MAYLILHREVVEGRLIWWRPDRRGYTANIDEAGRYGYDEAQSIARIRGDDFPVHESRLQEFKIARVVVTEHGDNGAKRRAIIEECEAARGEPSAGGSRDG